MWTEKLLNVVLDHGCKRDAVYEPYRRTYAQTKFLIEHTSVVLNSVTVLSNSDTQ